MSESSGFRPESAVEGRAEAQMMSLRSNARLALGKGRSS